MVDIHPRYLLAHCGSSSSLISRHRTARHGNWSSGRGLELVNRSDTACLVTGNRESTATVLYFLFFMYVRPSEPLDHWILFFSHMRGSWLLGVERGIEEWLGDPSGPGSVRVRWGNDWNASNPDAKPCQHFASKSQELDWEYLLQFRLVEWVLSLNPHLAKGLSKSAALQSTLVLFVIDPGVLSYTLHAYKLVNISRTC